MENVHVKTTINPQEALMNCGLTPRRLDSCQFTQSMMGLKDLPLEDILMRLRQKGYSVTRRENELLVACNRVDKGSSCGQAIFTSEITK